MDSVTNLKSGDHKGSKALIHGESQASLMSEQLNQLNVGGLNTNPSKAFFPPRFTNNYESRDIDIASMGS